MSWGTIDLAKGSDLVKTSFYRTNGFGLSRLRGTPGKSLLALCLFVALPVTLGFTAKSLAPEILLYSDHTGIPSPTEVWVWPYPATGDTIDLRWPGGCPADPDTCARTVATAWAGWGIFLIYPNEHSINLPTDCLSLDFYVKSPCDLSIEVEDANHVKSTELISNHGWNRTNPSWQFISIPRSEFEAGGADLSKAFGLFLVTATTTCTFYVDYVRWVGGASCVSVEPTSWGRIKALYR
jgi:hypothetical protein